MSDRSTTNTKKNGLVVPVIEIIAPDVTEPIYFREVTISGLVISPGGAPADLQLVINGIECPISSDGSWQSTLLLNFGVNAIVIEVFDRIDPAVSARLDLEIMRQVTPLPVVTIDTPTDNWETTDPAVIVSGTAFAYGEPMNVIERIEVNGALAQRLLPNRWNVNFVVLNLGANTIEAVVSDTEGNLGRAQITVIRC